MKGILKKTAAAALSLAMLAGTVPALPAEILSAAPITAAAADGSTVAFSAEDQTLVLLKGQVNKADVREWARNEDVKHVVAQKGAVLPENCDELFSDFEYTKTIDLSKADASNTTSMYCMFSGCTKLVELNLSNLDTSNVKSMEQMFYACKSLTSLNFSSLDTSNVESMDYMFTRCESLTSLDLSSFDTSNVTNMMDMFSGCRSLTELDLSSFNTVSLKLAKWMFDYCSQLETIMVSPGWNLKKVTDSTYNMFYNCKKLKGENGTEYSESHTKMEYARIDREGAPGYLTASTSLFAVIKGASISLGGDIGINFYVDSYNKDIALAYMYDQQGTEPIAEYLDPSSMIVESGTYKGCYKITYSVNTLQTDRKIFFEAMGYVCHADGSLNTSAPVTYLLYDTEGNRLDKDRFGFSVQDYLDRYVEGVNEERDALVASLDNYCKAARNYFCEETNELAENDTPASAFKWSLFNLNGRKMALVLDSQTAVRIFDDSDAQTAVLASSGETITKTDGYFEIKNIPAHYLNVMPYQLVIGEERVTFQPINYGYLALTKTEDAGLHALVRALYAFSQAAYDYRESIRT